MWVRTSSVDLSWLSPCLSIISLRSIRCCWIISSSLLICSLFRRIFVSISLHSLRCLPRTYLSFLVTKFLWESSRILCWRLKYSYLSLKEVSSNMLYCSANFWSFSYWSWSSDIAFVFSSFSLSNYLFASLSFSSFFLSKMASLPF